jgi:hypothetical protein
VKHDGGCELKKSLSPIAFVLNPLPSFLHGFIKLLALPPYFTLPASLAKQNRYNHGSASQSSYAEADYMADYIKECLCLIKETMDTTSIT